MCAEMLGEAPRNQKRTNSPALELFTVPIMGDIGKID